MSIHKAGTPGSLLQTSVEVWRTLIKAGGIEPAKRDADLIRQLSGSLGLGAKGSFESRLKACEVSIEDLITAIFQAFAPFGEMMADLMSLFESAGASASERNLVIAFNFEKDRPALEFDLNAFRGWRLAWNHVRRSRAVPVWDHDTLRSLCSVLERSADRVAAAQAADATRWLVSSWPELTDC